MKLIYTKDISLKKEDIDKINNICFGDVSKEDVMYDFIDIPIGMFLLYEENDIIGKVGIHFRKSKYEEKEYNLGGFGGLAVLPEYRNKGYGSKLIKSALDKLNELNCDISCMCVDKNKDAYKLYEKFGYQFLNRDAYFFDLLNRRKSDDSVMILGIKNIELANHILNTDFEFNYGNEKGYW